MCPLPDDEILALSKLKGFADNKRSVSKFAVYFGKLRKLCGRRRKCWLPGKCLKNCYLFLEAQKTVWEKEKMLVTRKVSQKLLFILGSIGNSGGKGENAGDQKSVSKIAIYFEKLRKQCGKRRKCWLPEKRLKNYYLFWEA